MNHDKRYTNEEDITDRTHPKKMNTEKLGEQKQEKENITHRNQRSTTAQ